MGSGLSERRIGTLDNISDEYSFRLRYAVAAEPNHPEMGLPRSTHVENAIGYRGPAGRETLHNDAPVGPRSADLWDILAELIRRCRWAVIRESEEEAREAKNEQSSKSAESLDAKSVSGSAPDSSPNSESRSLTHLTANETDDSDVEEASPATDGRSNSEGRLDTVDEPGTVDRRHSLDEYDALNDLHPMPSKTLMKLIIEHPSFGSRVMPEEKQRLLRQAATTLSSTEAYGTILPPSKAMYQFDDVLQSWKSDRYVLPWLQPLRLVELTLI